MQIIKENFEKLHLSSEFLEDIIEKITSVAEVKKIYIFGSYARGEEREDSDIDIYVIISDSEKRKNFEVRGSFYYALCKMKKEKDIFARSEDKFNSRKQNLQSLEAAVNREGVLIYG